MEALGVKLAPWQLRWALEPVLSDSTVAIADDALVAQAGAVRVPTGPADAAAIVAADRPSADPGSRRLSAVDCKGNRAY
jgi:hypothetical protein